MKTILEKEINLIKDKSKRDATRDCIAIRENELRDYPASISGRYHPPEERGPGGLLLHIARMGMLEVILAPPRHLFGNFVSCDCKTSRDDS